MDCLLLSNHLLENVEQQLARFHIRHFFTGISCNDKYDASFIRKLNKRERLKAYMDENGYSSSRAFIVGDTFEEAEIASALGLISFSITGGCISRQRLVSSNPDYMVDSLEEIIIHLVKLWKLEYQKAS